MLPLEALGWRTRHVCLDVGWRGRALCRRRRCEACLLVSRSGGFGPLYVEMVIGEGVGVREDVVVFDAFFVTVRGAVTATHVSATCIDRN